jgi:hypothetical protein
MDALWVIFSLALPWLLGVAVLFALGWPRGGFDDVPWLLRKGFGYSVGAVLLTLWMRLLSVAGIPFGRVSIALPLLTIAAALLVWGARTQRSLGAGQALRSSLVIVTLPRWQKAVWIALLAWIAVRFGLLAAEIAWRPLYPWDAWVQWATKARVWFELGRIAPFGNPEQWLAGTPGIFFDASPNYPATVPLLQVWTCVMLGRWDDSAMNWPWLALLVSLCIAVYAVLRGEKVAPLAALCGAYFVASLPLLDVHTALAGYADLPQGVVYTLAALATYRWCLRRDAREGIVALFLACACPLIKNPGLIWALTLVPAVVVTLLPRRGLRLLAVGAAAGVLALIVLARTELNVLGYQLRLDFAPAWRELVRTYFLMGNWNLLWYGLIVLWIVAARRLFRPPLLPLSVIATAGIGFLFVVFSITDAAVWMADLTTANRATLHIAPVLITLGVLTWNQLNVRSSHPLAAGAASPADSPVRAS